MVPVIVANRKSEEEKDYLTTIDKIQPFFFVFFFKLNNYIILVIEINTIITMESIIYVQINFLVKDYLSKSN